MPLQKWLKYLRLKFQSNAIIFCSFKAVRVSEFDKKKWEKVKAINSEVNFRAVNLTNRLAEDTENLYAIVVVSKVSLIRI